MNTCSLSGRLAKPAVLRNTEPKALSFTLEARYGYSETDQKERVAWVPCVLFNPTREQEELLTQPGPGLYVELEGRLSGSAPDANGGRKFPTEVIVKHWTFTVLTLPPAA